MTHDSNPGSISHFAYQNGFNKWEAYGVPGRPFLTGGVIAAGTELKIEFPTITKSITVVTSGSGGSSGPLRVHFDTTASTNVTAQHRYITLSDDVADPEGGRFEFDVRTRDIFLSAPDGAAGFELCAICVQVSKTGIQTLSGSGINAN